MNNTQTIYIYNGVDEVPYNVTHVRVGDSVTVIPEFAFHERRHLEEVDLPEELIKIENSAFSDCTSLRSINIPSTVKEIGERAFYSCQDLEVVGLPIGLQTLGYQAFCRCKCQRISIPPSLKIIGRAAFLSCESLTDVAFSEGLLRISRDAFSYCTSLESVKLPSSLKVIEVEAFDGCKLLNEIDMPDTMETIEECAFDNCNITQFRIPPLITDVDLSILVDNACLVSLELPENTSQIINSYRADYFDLRNIALPSECEIDEDTDEFDLLEAVPNDDAKEDDETTLDALKHRLDELPVHRICYYQSYHNNETTMQHLKREINPWTAKPPGQLNTTGKEKDCLGMTPLHILACSTKPTIEMYRLLIDKYPETLIMKDKWGDIPLLYALWCNVPTEVLDLLVESYKTLHPEYQFDWSGMLLTLAKRDVALANIQDLVNTQQNSFSDQEYDMQQVVTTLTARNTQVSSYKPGTSVNTLQFLLRVSITDRLDLLNITNWRIDLEKSIGFFCDETEVERETRAVYAKLATYELIKRGDLSTRACTVETQDGRICTNYQYQKRRPAQQEGSNGH